MRVDEVVDLCAAEAGAADDPALRRLAGLLRSLLHASYRERWIRVKDAYAPFSPDVETRQQQADPGRSTGEQARRRLVEELRTVLDDANYDEVPREVLDRALGESSLFRVQLHADLDDFADLLVFRRGTAQRSQRVERWKGLRSEQIDYLEYSRVVLYARYQDRDWFNERDRDLEDLPFVPGKAVLKLFQGVPESDLEMLLPNTEVRMRAVDKVLLGVPALASGIVVATTKLAATFGLLLLLAGAGLGLRSRSPDLDTGALLTLLGGAFALGGYLWKQYQKFTNRRTAYLQALSENLYHKSLGDGPGVLFTVLDSAEEEDVKESLLAYAYLLRGPLSVAELDRRIEQGLADAGLVGDGRVDFEIEDALSRLEQLGLVTVQGEACTALPVAEAVARLRASWREMGDALLA